MKEMSALRQERAIEEMRPVLPEEKLTLEEFLAWCDEDAWDER